jgi:hypothetical protein
MANNDKQAPGSVKFSTQLMGDTPLGQAWRMTKFGGRTARGAANFAINPGGAIDRGINGLPLAGMALRTLANPGGAIDKVFGKIGIGTDGVSKQYIKDLKDIKSSQVKSDDEAEKQNEEINENFKKVDRRLNETGKLFEKLDKETKDGFTKISDQLKAVEDRTDPTGEFKAFEKQISDVSSSVQRYAMATAKQFKLVDTRLNALEKPPVSPHFNKLGGFGSGAGYGKSGSGGSIVEDILKVLPYLEGAGGLAGGLAAYKGYKAVKRSATGAKAATSAAKDEAIAAKALASKEAKTAAQVAAKGGEEASAKVAAGLAERFGVKTFLKWGAKLFSKGLVAISTVVTIYEWLIPLAKREGVTLPELPEFVKLFGFTPDDWNEVKDLYSYITGGDKTALAGKSSSGGSKSSSSSGSGTKEKATELPEIDVDAHRTPFEVDTSADITLKSGHDFSLEAKSITFDSDNIIFKGKVDFTGAKVAGLDGFTSSTSSSSSSSDGGGDSGGDVYKNAGPATNGREVDAVHPHGGSSPNGSTPTPGVKRLDNLSSSAKAETVKTMQDSLKTGKPLSGEAVDKMIGMVGESVRDAKQLQDIRTFLANGGKGASGLDPARTAWCAATVNAALQQSGIKGSGSFVATSFLGWGQGVKPLDIQKGDVLVQARGHRQGQTGGHALMAAGVPYQRKDGTWMVPAVAGNASHGVRKYDVPLSSVQARRATDADYTDEARTAGLAPGGKPGPGGKDLDPKDMMPQQPQQQAVRGDTQERLYALAKAEVGGDPKATQMFMETVRNRAAARGQSIDKVMNEGYYPDSIRRINSGQVRVSANEKAMMDKAWDEVQKGSNLANYATGNASGKVNTGRAWGGGAPGSWGNMATANRERFVGEEKDRKWIEKARSTQQSLAMNPNVLKPGPGGTVLPMDVAVGSGEFQKLDKTAQEKVMADHNRNEAAYASLTAGVNGDLTPDALLKSKQANAMGAETGTEAKEPNSESVAPKPADNFANTGTSQSVPNPPPPNPPAPSKEVAMDHSKIGRTSYHPESEGGSGGSEGYGPSRTVTDPACSYCSL